MVAGCHAINCISVAPFYSIYKQIPCLVKAAAVEQYAKRANDYELEHDAARARVIAERRCGELLTGMEKAKGSQGKIQEHTGGSVLEPPVEGKEEPKKLSELGLSKKQSMRFQQLAAVPEEEFEKALTADGIKPTAANYDIISLGLTVAP